MKVSDSTRVLILAGGPGTRLRPLTVSTPKPMLGIAGKPLLYYVIQEVEKLGLSKITIAAAYLKEQIIEYFGDRYDFLDNTGRTMAEAVFETARTSSEQAIVGLSGDVLLKADSIHAAVEAYWQYQPDAVLMLTRLEQPAQKKWNFIIEGSWLKDLRVESHPTNFERVGLVFARAALGDISNNFTEHLGKAGETDPRYSKFATGWNYILRRLLDCGCRIYAKMTSYPVHNVNTSEELKAAADFISTHLQTRSRSSR